jgi:hypothetical protein
MAKTITHKTKRKAKKRPIDAQPKRTKEKRELVPFMVESYVIHNPFNVASM